MDMFRQLGTVGLAAFYLVISAGFTLNAHYCGGAIVDIELFGTPENCCSETKSCHQDASECCDDQAILVQLDQWQLPSTLPTYKDEVISLPTFSQTLASVFITRVKQENPLIKLPPPKSNDLWLRYHRLTYYE